MALTKVTYSMIDGAAFNITDYGAVGDGTTDATAAIQSAANAAAGGILYIPEGNFKISAPINISSNTKVVGAGIGSRIFGTAITPATFPLNPVDGSGQAIFLLNGVDNISFDSIHLDTSTLLYTTVNVSSRAITAGDASYVWVSNCKFTVSGAATAFERCDHYYITNNDIYVNKVSGSAAHDGIIDQWYGSNNFVIDNNNIVCNVTTNYGILVTGANTESTLGTPSYQFSITNNKVTNISQSGIHVNGRDGQHYDCVISGNIVENVSDYYGISVADTTTCVVSNNILSTIKRAGIAIYSENVAYAGCFGITVTGNSLRNTNTQLSASPNNPSIYFNQATQCIASGNVIRQTNGTQAIYFSVNSLYCRESGNQYDNNSLYPYAFTNSTTSYPSSLYSVLTVTGVSNVANIYYKQANSVVIGEQVIVYFKIGVESVSASPTDTTVRITLPYPATLPDTSSYLAGSATDAYNTTAAIYADTVNNAAIMQFKSPATATYIFYGSFSYRLAT